MLYIRYILDDYDHAQPDTKILIEESLAGGLKDRTLSEMHLCALVLFAKGFSFEEIDARLFIRSEELLLSVWRYLEEKTGLSDYIILKRHKGKVEKQWIAKAEQVARTS